MGNMSYCRFTNTVGDLEDCYDALLEGKEISDAEKPYAERLIDLCSDILESARRDEFSSLDSA